MCIRDRLWGFYHFMNGEDPIAQAKHFVASCRNYFGNGIPVLDYEMYGLSLIHIFGAAGALTGLASSQEEAIQRSGQLEVAFTQAGSTAETAQSVYSNSVSYTHLDVYKRQDLHRERDSARQFGHVLRKPPRVRQQHDEA